MTVLAIKGRELHNRALERGGVLIRHGARHDVWRGPLGTFTIPNGRNKPITGAIVRCAARALGTTTRDLLS